MGDVQRQVPPYGAVMTTASIGSRNQVATLPLAVVRLGALLACAAVSLGMWWAFAQVILRVIA